jgi:hypothetical protein
LAGWKQRIRPCPPLDHCDAGCNTRSAPHPRRCSEVPQRRQPRAAARANRDRLPRCCARDSLGPCLGVGH